MNNSIITLKGDLHIHTNEDPVDKKIINYSNFELVDHLDNLDFDFFSITLHDYIMPIQLQEKIRDYSKSKGMIYFNNGVEKSINKAHVLIYGLEDSDLEKITDFESLREIKNKYSLQNKRLLIGASHPHFPSQFCIGKRLGQEHNIFHFVEYNSFYIKLINFNNKLRPNFGRYYPIKLMVGNSDAHDLERIGHTYTLLNIPNNHFQFRNHSNLKDNSPYQIPKSKEEFKSMLKECSISEYDKIKNELMKKIIFEDRFEPEFVKVVTKPLNNNYLIKSFFRMFIKPLYD